MKLVRYSADGKTSMGVIEGDQVVALSGVATAQEFIIGGAAALDAARKAVVSSAASGAGRRALSSVQLLAPVVPATMLCSGSNYTDHNKEKANTPISGKEPEFFVKTADCIIGPNESIVLDHKLTKKLDAETELAIVIGKPGRRCAGSWDHRQRGDEDDRRRGCWPNATTRCCRHRERTPQRRSRPRGRPPS